MDNSPAWDGPLGRVDGAFDGDIPRPDLDHAASSERPSDEEYSTYLYLAARYRDHDCDDSRESTPFRVVDPGMNALWVRSEIALARIAEILGETASAERHRADARHAAAAIENLWDDELAFPVPLDALTGEQLRFRSVSGLMTLLVPDSPHADSVITTLRGPHFGLGKTAMVPSSDLTASEFDTSQYWRGPSWFNTAWMIATALEERGHGDEARALALDIGALALASDFAEYVDPYSGDPRGTRRFSWTAALALDLTLRSA
jgi:glycogen debranching enzyme